MLTSLLLAIREISRNRVRASLTILGILIGVAALIAVTTLASGVSAKVSESMDGLASNSLLVEGQTPPVAKKRVIVRPLTEADGRQIARELRSVADVAPVLSSSVVIVYGEHQERARAVGTTTTYFAIKHLMMARGVSWTAVEETEKVKVCVLGSTLANALFGAEADPIGRSVRIGAFPCRVVGVLASQGASGFGEDPNTALLMPLSSFRAHIDNPQQGRITSLVVAASSGRAEHDIRALLRQRHRIGPDAPPDFAVWRPEELQQTQLVIAGALSALLLCVASVSLVVGGIGVMNIMLVSVAERTREIGIRISIGATSSDILTQFLIEAILLTSLGGLFGLAIGAFGSMALSKLVGFPLRPSPVVALIAVGTSGAIGVLFGYLPARRAAQLDPIQALRAD